MVIIFRLFKTSGSEKEDLAPVNDIQAYVGVQNQDF